MIEAIILAAGQSRRMAGVNKLLLPVGGEAMVRRSVRLYQAAADRVIVVLGHQADAVADALAGLDVQLVTNPDYAAGHHGSARLGLAAAALEEVGLDGAGVILALADQPLLTEGDLQALTACFDGQHIIIPRHHGQRGNPVLFPATTIRAILADPVRPSPRAYCDSHPDNIRWFDATNSHFTTDIDTPTAAKALLGIDTSTLPA